MQGYDIELEFCILFCLFVNAWPFPCPAAKNISFGVSALTALATVSDVVKPAQLTDWGGGSFDAAGLARSDDRINERVLKPY